MAIRVTLDPYGTSNIERRVMFIKGGAVLGNHSACDWVPGTPGPDRSPESPFCLRLASCRSEPGGSQGASSSPPGHCAKVQQFNCPEPAVRPAARSAEATIHTGSINFWLCQSINQSTFNVLGANRQKFSSLSSYRQNLFPTCKTFPKETTTCIWFTQRPEVCNSATILEKVHMLESNMIVRWTIKDKVLLVLHTSR